MDNPPNDLDSSTQNNAESHWQTNCTNINEVFEHLFMNPIGADICFIPLLNASDPPKKFPAHKVVLLGRSPVLQAQFKWDQIKELNDRNVENENGYKVVAPKKANNNENLIQEVELPDVEPEGFEQFLRFCYTDKAKFTTENVTLVLYTANYYNVPALVKQAVKFICDNLKSENAFEMLEFANRLRVEEIKELEECALTCIRNHTKKTLKSDGFLGISQQTLDLFASQDFLKITEIELFEALIRWAKNRREIPGNEEMSLRQLLGPALFRVRFEKMDVADFEKVIVPANVLTDAEIVYISKKLENYADNVDDGTFFSDPECPFPEKFETRRGNRHIIFDIKCSQIGEWVWNEKTTSEKVYIKGVTFFLEFEAKEIYDIQSQWMMFQMGRRTIGLSVLCDGDENFLSCWATIELILVSKTTGQEDKSLWTFSHRFQPNKNSYDCSRFVPPFQELVDPENGWIQDDTVTLKARVKVVGKPKRTNTDTD